MDSATAHVADELFELGKLITLPRLVVYKFVVGNVALDDRDLHAVLGDAVALLGENVWIRAGIGGDDVGDANLGSQSQMVIGHGREKERELHGRVVIRGVASGKLAGSGALGVAIWVEAMV